MGRSRGYPGLWIAPRLRLAHDPEKCVAVFRKDHAQNKNQERDFDSSESHRALAGL
jgi:hypothetical protein